MSRLLLLVVLGVLVFLAGYGNGQRAERNAQDAAKLRVTEGRIERHNTATVAGNVAEKQAVTREQATEKHFQVIRQKEIVHVQKQAGATGCSLDADGLRLWREANAGADPASAASAPDAAMHGAAPSDQRGADGPAQQPHHDGALAAPVPGPPAGAGRVDGGR